MKKIFLIFLILIVNFTILKSQTNENKTRIFDLNINYIYSIKGVMDPKAYDCNKEIPYGIGISSSLKFNKRLYAELGLAFKTSKENIEKYNQIAEYGYSGYVIHTYKRNFIDLPLQLNYNFLKFKALDLFIFSGFKGTLFFYKDNYDYVDSQSLFENNTNEINFAGFCGLKEYFKLHDRISLFSSQSYGYYFAAKHDKYRFESYQDSRKIIDFKIGLAYKFKEN